MARGRRAKASLSQEAGTANPIPQAVGGIVDSVATVGENDELEMAAGLPEEGIDVDARVDVDKKYRLESQTQKDAYFKQGDLVYAPFPLAAPGKGKVKESM
jgi:hypothetical protein